VTFVTREEGRQLTQIEMLVNTLIEEARYEGFTPSQPREEKPAAPPPEPEPEGPARPPKTLGSKFRTRRRRRFP